MKVPEPRKLKSGTWFIQLRLNGVSVPVTGRTSKECRDAAALIKSEHRAGKKIYRRSEKTLRQAAREYIDRRKGRVSPTTIEGYEKVLRNYFQNILDLPLGKITWEVFDAELSRECNRKSNRGKPFAPKTIKGAFEFYNGILKENNITFDKGFVLPEIKPTPIQLPSAEEVYNAVKGSPIELSCLLAMWLTMTISEIRGLTKSKSIYKGQISIMETVVDVDGKPVRKAGGKEVKRSRTQDIPPYIQSLIDAVDGDVICPLSSKATNKRLQILLEEAGVKKISFHKLRHISASTMAMLNIPSNYAQEKGGWKTDQVMKQVYTHTFTDARKAADRKMDDRFEEIIFGEKKATMEVTVKLETLEALNALSEKSGKTIGEILDEKFPLQT